MPPLYVTYMNRLDVAALALTDDEILARGRGAWRPRDAARR